MVFTVYMSQVEQLRGATVVARATSLEGALAFIDEFCEWPMFLSWTEHGGRYVAELCDWFDCWFPDPPVHVRITTPPGYRPPARGIRTRKIVG